MFLKSNKQIMDELADRIQSDRLRLNLTQDEVAIKAGVSRSTIKSIESGRGCTLFNLIKVARAMSRAGDFDALFKYQERPTERWDKLRRGTPKRMRASSSKGVL